MTRLSKISSTFLLILILFWCPNIWAEHIRVATNDSYDYSFTNQTVYGSLTSQSGPIVYSSTITLSMVVNMAPVATSADGGNSTYRAVVLEATVSGKGSEYKDQQRSISDDFAAFLSAVDRREVYRTYEVSPRGYWRAHSGSDGSTENAFSRAYLDPFASLFFSPMPDSDTPFTQGLVYRNDRREEWKTWYEEVQCTNLKVWRDGESEVELHYEKQNGDVLKDQGIDVNIDYLPSDIRRWVLGASPLRTLHAQRRSVTLSVGDLPVLVLYVNIDALQPDAPKAEVRPR